MKFGIPPFYQKEKNYPLLFKKIKEKEVNFGNTIQLSDQMKDIIKKVTFFSHWESQITCAILSC